MATVSPKGLEFIKQREGLRLVAYDDGTGTLTIGYGHTGPYVHEGLIITQDQADALLRGDLAEFEHGVEELLAHDATPGQFDAMVSLAFNAGLATFKSSDVLQFFNQGNLTAAAESFGHIIWATVNGQHVILEGLVNRRIAEAVLFMGG